MTGYEVLCQLDYKGEYGEKYSEILSDIPKGVNITRKQCAIIVHEYLRKICNEADEKNVEAAKVLKDLYDCRICASHIMQVYVKGIMTPLIEAGNGLPVIFGLKDTIDNSEVDLIVARVHDKSKRVIISANGNG